MDKDKLETDLRLKLDHVISSRAVSGLEIAQNRDRWDVFIRERFNMDVLVCSVVNYIWMEELDDIVKEESYIIPSNWFEHLKQDCFPKWLLQYFPAKGTTKIVRVRVKAKAYYPTLQAKGYKGVLKFHEVPESNYKEF